MAKYKEQEQQSKSVLEMSADEARMFFLKPESYCGIDLPPYFTFNKLLSGVAKELFAKQLSELSSRPRNHEGVNYSMLSNKDGRHAWRPFQLIGEFNSEAQHPAG